MLTQQQIEAIILYHLYGESEASARRFRDAVSAAAKEIAAQQNLHADSSWVCEHGRYKMSCRECHPERTKAVRIGKSPLSAWLCGHKAV